MKIFDKLEKYKNFVWFLFSAIFLFAFVKFFDDVIIEKSVSNLDTILANSVYSLRTTVLTQIMKIITDLGNPLSVAIFLCVVFLILFLLKKRKYIFSILISSVFGEIFVYVMKIIVQRPRPLIQNALIIETDPSFPSGHAMIAVTVYGLIFYFLMEISKKNWQKILVSIFGILIIGGIGFSRIYLGVHWPSDILASYLLGGGWTCFVIGLLKNRNDIRRMFSNRKNTVVDI